MEEHDSRAFSEWPADRIAQLAMVFESTWGYSQKYHKLLLDTLEWLQKVQKGNVALPTTPGGNKRLADVNAVAYRVLNDFANNFKVVSTDDKDLAKRQEKIKLWAGQESSDLSDWIS